MNYEDKLKEITLADKKFVIMTAENRAAIRNIPDVLAEQFIDTGINEQTLIGSAAGLALRGRSPLVHALAAFLTMRAFEFIRTDIGYPCLPVKLIGSIPGLLSEANGPTYQAIEDIGLMRLIPNMHIFCPADKEDLLIGLGKVFNSPAPTYIRFVQSDAHYEHQKDFDIGKAELISTGKDISILTYGFLFSQALKAKNLLEKDGLSIGLINLRMLKPIDEELILKSVSESKTIVTLEDHFLNSGLYSIISEILVRNQILKPVLPLGFNEQWFKPGFMNEILDNEGLSAAKIADKIKCFIEIGKH